MAALRVSLAVACAAAVVSRAAAVHRQVYSTEPAATIGYNKQTGKLKILQFADMHYENGASTKCSQIPSHADWPYPCSDLNTTEFLRELLVLEKPDFVVFTGDNIDGGAVDAKTSIDEWVQILKDTAPNTHWAAVEGNHDQQSDQNRSTVMKILSDFSESVSVTGPSWIHGYGNYYVKVNDDKGANAFNLYFMDSGDNSKLSTVHGYDWVWTNQQAWFLNVSAGLQADARAAGATTIIPAMALFHICLPEYTMMLDAKTPIVGHQGEACGCASVDSGLFTAFMEAGDVRIATVGHDHNNDYCGNWKGIELCYGGGAGFHAYGYTGRARRARFFEIDQATGTVMTWKRADPWLGPVQYKTNQTGMPKLDFEQLYPTPSAAERSKVRSSDYTQSFWRPSAEQEAD